MTTTSDSQLFRVLKGRLGEHEAETMANYLIDEIKQQFDSRQAVYATKADIEKVRAGIMRSVYGAGLVQLVAIISSVLVIVLLLPAKR